jgi:hypothetical protein
MKRRILQFFGAAILASPAAPQGCATVSVGIGYQGEHADYRAAYTINNGRRDLALTVESDSKSIKGLRR